MKVRKILAVTLPLMTVIYASIIMLPVILTGESIVGLTPATWEYKGILESAVLLILGIGTSIIHFKK